MLPSKSCKTINAKFLLKNFGLTFFDRFKTGTYLVIRLAEVGFYNVFKFSYNKFYSSSSASAPPTFNLRLALLFHGNTLATTLSNNWLSLWQTPAKLPRIRLAPKRQPPELIALLSCSCWFRSSKLGEDGSRICMEGGVELTVVEVVPAIQLVITHK